MAHKPTLSEIRNFLTELGLGRNPIERVTHHKGGAVTIWVVGLAEPVEMSPSPSTAMRSEGEPEPT